ncbi:MAG: sugar phosphate isomerase/epimerase [Lachnospiraceae bacterium]|nr:sugar phosphate isomerase/epimerase [Lachnospiraceae bacterium]
MTDHKTVIQVQPRFDFRDEWEVLAAKEDLKYEALDFSTQPALIESGLFEEYLEWYGSCGRTTSIHGFFIDVNPASGDPDFRALSQARCRKSCETAVALGASNVVFHSSCFPFLRGVYLEVWSKRCADFYQLLASEYDLNIFIENSPDIDTTAIRALMERITDRRVGVCLDVGHANYSHDKIGRWFEDLGQWIGYLHLSDNMGTYDDHLPLGEGNVDWAEADRLWRDLDRDTFITLEINGLVAAARAVEFLKGKGYFGYNKQEKG